MADNTIDILLNARMNVSDAVGGVSEIQKAMRGLTLPKGISADLEKSFSKLTPLLKDYQKQLNKGFSSQKDIKNFNLLKEKIDSVFGDIKSQIKEVNGQEIRLKANTQEIDAVKNKIVKAQADLNNALQNVFKKNQSATSIETAFGKLENAIPKNWTKVTDMMSKASGSFKAGNYAEFNRQLQSTLNYIEKLSSTSQVDLAHKLGMDKAKTDVTDAQKYFNNFFNSLKTNIKEANNIESLRTKLSELGVELEGLNTKSLEDGPKAFEEWVQSIMNVDGALDQLHGSTQNTANSMVRMVDEVNELKSSTQYFFSLRNMINLLKRGIDEAVQSVKELDKAMTETAVVTDYKVSDLWGMLPEYTRVANQLGATTQGAYETMTLYYQQGLEQQQAFELGAETMKMARIAGLDYAETTDMMTAALRGFNMELNETSAKRVNDVYSELAAITASDTEELGTAMQRTASIAASAGASFEGTTAFLAQAIETTREPAENIGTAMKTIVARFQEMKKNPLEIGEVDGEEVDYNKIDAALKTIGVDLKDTNGQFRDFDQVMLDISARWDGLSQSQQRYIATVAAGSRQQSRFIAMVSNYERTMQLMEAANNSAGASDEQFGKTMDSLESKLNQLHNAWQQFTMGIANNSMIKMAVDGLTGFLNVTNKIIDVLSLGSGALKSFLSVFAAFTGLKIAGRGANALIGGLGGLVDPKSTVKEGLKTGLFGQGKNAAQAKAITTPIVSSLSKISGQIAAIAKRQGIKDAGQKGSTAGVKETSKEDYANTKRLFNQLSGKEGFKMGDTSKLFGSLDAKHQLSMFNNSPGTKLAMKQASLNWFNSKGLSKELTNEGKQFINSIYKGMSQGQIPIDKGIELIGRPDLWGEHFATDTAKAISKNFNLSDDERKNIVDKTWSRLGMNLAAPETRKAWLKENQDKYDKTHSQVIQDLFGHTQSQGKVSDLGRLANDIGSIGDKFTQAGYGITTFGTALSQLDGPIGAVGTGIAAFGGAISSMGMMVSGATSLITVFSEGIQIAGTSIAISGSAIAAVAAPLAAAAAAFLLVRAHIKKVKEAGEEVTKTFNETNKTVSDNISKLKSYQSEFAVLSKGVDSNGNNVSLDDSQYQRYLEIVEDIAAINPSIVEGYNAQGHAIINNNKALTETLKLQEESQKKALEDYTKTNSLQKLINARNLNNDFKGINIKGSSPGVYDGSGHGTEGRQKPIGLGKDVSTIADQLRLLQGTDALGNTIRVNDEMLQKYGIESLDALISGEEQAVKNFIKHRDKIQADLTNSGFELSESITKGFETLDKDAGAFDEAIKPVYDNLLANVSNSKAFESIAPEFREALNMGLKDLASQDLSASDMSRAATTMATKFANLTTGSGKYQEAMDKVADAQEKFAANLEETEYKANVQPAIDDLVRLKEEALKEGGAYGDALAEYLENQIEQIANFTEEGATTIQEGLNTATDAIAQAESALDNFNEATKKDFSTAAEGMRSIYDKTFETYKDSYGNELEKHTEGEGDNTFWTGAEALLSEDKLAGGVKEVTKSLKELEPWLREGKEGMDAFFTDVVNNENLKKLEKDGLISLDKNGWFKEIPEDQWNAVADALGISEDLLTSMLNKARQFGLIEFDNLEKVREALATSDSAIAGVESNAQGQKALYVKEDTMRQNLREAGYNTKESQDKVIEKLLKEQNVNMVNTMEKLTKDQANGLVEAWGVKDLPDLITKMSETGDYNREEILDLAEKAGLGSGEAAADVYDKVISALDNPELAAQTSELQSINAKLDAIVDKETGKGVEDHEAAQKEAHEIALGENGIATNFAKGLDTEGKILDTGSFAVVRDELEKTKAQYEENAAYYTERAKYANEQDKAHFEELAELYTNDAKAIAKAITEGEKTAEKKKKDAEKRKTSDKFKRDEKEGKNNGKEPAPSPAVSSNRPLEQTEKRNIETTEKHHKIEETEKTTNYDSSETAEHKKLQKLWEEDKNNPHLDKDVTVEGNDKGLKDLNKDVNKFDARFNNPFMAYVKANMDEANKGVIDFNTYVQKQNPQVPVGANTKSAKSSISSLYSGIRTLFVPIKPDFQGTWEKTIKISKSVTSGTSATKKIAQDALDGSSAKGRNNKASINSLFSFNSAARGYGRLGPKGKGGPTLTGELGYEIAWLPSENRSMILGANGPQMIDLPGDAVVWTHEQSKKILKQKAIPAGSHYKEPYTTGDSSSYTVTYTSSSIVSKPKPKPKPKNPKTTKPSQEDKDSKKDKTSKKIYSWWEKISRQVKEAERNANKLGEQTTKVFKDIRASIDKVNNKNKEFIAYQNQIITKNQKIVNNSNKHLKALASGGSKSERKKVQKARKTLNSKSASKKEKQRAKKNIKKWTSGNEWATVKWKGKGDKEKSQKIDMSQFIKYDKKTGTYYVDKKAINAKTKDSKAKRKAIQEKAYEQIDKYQDRKNDAQNAIDKAKDELANYRKEIDNTFFGWKNELTQVLRITSEIERKEAEINQNKAEQDRTEFFMDNLDLSGGVKGTNGQLNTLWSNYGAEIAKNIKLNQEEIGLKNELIKANEDEMRASAQLTDKLVTYEGIDGATHQESEKAMYERIKNIAENGTGLGWDELSTQEKKIFARQEAFQRGIIVGDPENGYSLNKGAEGKGGLVDYLAAIGNGKIQEELGSLLQEVWDDVNDKTLENINLKTETYELETENYKLEQQRVDRAKELAEQLYGWKNTLTQILQLTQQIEQAEKRTAYLKSADDYYAAKQQAGMPGQGVSSTEILSAYVGQMLSSIDQIQKRTDLLGQQRQGLQDYISGKDITKQINNINKLPQTDLTKARLDELKKEQEIREKAKKYVTTSTNADGTVNVTYDSAGLEQDIGKEFDADTANKIEEYAQELVDKNNEIADTMSASLSDITELYRGLGELKQEYADRAKELREAYGAYQQKQIDAVKNVYTAIDNNFKELINQVKTGLQQRRQQEDNAKTEQDISQKQQRLAALRADTSGGHQIEIAQLQKEISDAQQSYGRTLEDQMLDKISQQGDIAAQQRQQQIDLMQGQRDIAAKTGADAEQINQWLQNPEKYKSNITAVLQSEAGWSAMAAAEQAVFNSSLDTKLTELNTLPEKINTTSATLATIKPAIEATESNIKSATQTAIDNIPTKTLEAFQGNMKSLDEKIDIANSGIEAVAKKLDDELAKKIKADEDAAKKKAEEEAAAKKKADEEAAKQKADEEAAKQKAAKDKAQKQLTDAWNAYKTVNWNDVNDVRTVNGGLNHAIQEAQKQGIDTSNYSVDKAIEIFKPKPAPPSTTSNKGVIGSRGGSGTNGGSGGTTYSPYMEFLMARASKQKTGDKHWGEIGKTGLTTLFNAKGARTEWDALYELANFGGSGAPLYGAWDKILKAYIDYKGSKKEAAEAIKDNFGKYLTDKRKKGWKTAFGKNYPSYKTGGVADFTGPAWLDGTPSKPELVLNATDTQNFLALRDVLSKALSSTNSVTNSYGGDAMYEININVDHLNNDYDVDKVVEKVKKEITKGAGYRNVTQVRNFR